jgi:hypothetical protein
VLPGPDAIAVRVTIQPDSQETGFNMDMSVLNGLITFDSSPVRAYVAGFYPDDPGSQVDLWLVPLP